MKKEPNIILFLTPKSQVSYLSSDISIRQGIEKFKAHGFTAVPVLNENDGTYCGIVTEGDFLRKIVTQDEYDIRELENENVMTILRKSFPAATVSTSFSQVVDLLMNQNFVPIVDDRNVFMGIITRKSCISYLREKQD